MIGRILFGVMCAVCVVLICPACTEAQCSSGNCNQSKGRTKYNNAMYQQSPPRAVVVVPSRSGTTVYGSSMRGSVRYREYSTREAHGNVPVSFRTTSTTVTTTTQTDGPVVIVNQLPRRGFFARLFGRR